MKSNSLLLILLLISQLSLAQTDSLHLVEKSLSSNSDLYFPSARNMTSLVGPNVSSFERVAKIPLNYNIGLLDFRIPLYNLQLDDNVSIPVTLVNANTGLKPTDIPSWVGNGWDLNIGGTIVQYFKGLDDFGAYGLQLSYARDSLGKYNAGNMNTEGRYNYFRHIANQEMDSQFDVFSLSLPGRTVQFYFSRDTVRFLNYENLKIELEDDIFSVTDEKGYQFLFEESVLSSGSYSDDVFGDMEFTEGAKTWFLTRIISPNGEQASFYYQKDIGYQVFEKSTSYSSGKVPDGNNCIEQPAYAAHYSNSSRIVSQYLLKKIEYPSGILKITFSDREDLFSSSGDPSKALKKLEHQNFKEGLIEQTEFFYNYLDPGYKDRLRLDSISLSGQVSSEKLSYSFEYYTISGAVPIPGLKKPGNIYNAPNHGVDYQGYYNGMTSNSNKVPYMAYSNNPYNSTAYIGGANRNPNAAQSRHGMLKKVIYPDKGYDEFEYEGNTYFKQDPSQYETAASSTYFEEEFQSKIAFKDSLTGSFSISASTQRIRYHILPPASIKIIRQSDMSEVFNRTVTNGEDYEQTQNLSLTPGQYQYQITGTGGAYFSILKATTDYLIETGGNRIKKIKRYPVADQPDIRNITYLSRNPIYNIEMAYPNYVAHPVSGSSYCNFCGSSFVVSEYNINIFEGMHIQYSKAVETSFSHGVQEFGFKPWVLSLAMPVFLNSYYYTNFPWRNGLLSEKFIRNNAKELTQSQSHSYTDFAMVSPYDHTGLAVKFNFHCPTAIKYDPSFSGTFFGSGVAPLKTDYFGRTLAINNQYSNSYMTWMSDTTEFSYNNRHQVYKIKKSRTGSPPAEQTLYYAQDYDDASEPGIADLKSKHIIGQPLKVMQTVDGTTTGGELIKTDSQGNIIELYHYESNTNHDHDPDEYLAPGFEWYESRQYNTKGQLTAFTTRSGVNHVYLWSYAFTHPVALISNATLAEIENLIGSIDSFGNITS